MSDLDDWEFVDDEDAKMTISAAVRYLLKGAASSDRGDLVSEIVEIVRQAAQDVPPDRPDPFDDDDAPGGWPLPDSKKPVSRPAAHRLTGGLFVDANDLPVSLAAKLDFAGPSVETLDAYRR